MTVGINYPWVRCGHDFGPSPPAWSGQRATRARLWGEVERDLVGLKAIGIEVVRWWILAGGVNYPVGRDARDLSEVRPSAGGLCAHAGGALHPLLGQLAGPTANAAHPLELYPLADTEPPTLPGAFIDDFRGLCEACRSAGVQLLPSLVSFEMFQPALVRSDGVIKRGRRPWVLGDRGERAAAFLDGTLAPLLAVSDAYRDAIFAWEVINEPGWAVSGGPLQVDLPAYGPWPSPRLVAPAAMATLIGAGVEMIDAAGFLSTVGFAHASSRWVPHALMAKLERLAATGRFVHQRHHYPTALSNAWLSDTWIANRGPWGSNTEPKRTLPEHDQLAVTPCLLGEMPTARGGSVGCAHWRDPELRESELDPDNYLLGRLALAERRGYPVALLWSARSGDSRRAWGPAQRAQVARFHQR